MTIADVDQKLNALNARGPRRSVADLDGKLDALITIQRCRRQQRLAEWRGSLSPAGHPPVADPAGAAQRAAFLKETR